MDLSEHVVDTGLLDLPPAVTATVTTPLVPLPPLSLQELASLAREVAMDIRELKDILPDYKLSQAQYDRLLAHPFYEKALHAVTIEWNSALSTHQRIKIEAATILENGMIALGQRMVAKDESLPAAVEAGKLFTKLAGIGEQDRQAGPGEKFTITINLGADAKLSRTLDITPKAETSGSASPLLAHAEGASD